jgi:Fuc2NAc and GlcNAc transferase
MQWGQELIGFGPLAPVLGVIGIIWVLNLFNFMDGIDGIAGVEGLFLALAGGGLALFDAAAPGFAMICFGFGAACAGFLVWNWAPASIFMGDAGSGFVGYLIAVLAVAAGFRDPAGLWVWLILGGVFFVDATITLLRRLLRGEKPHEAHRTHVYQRLSRAWGSHARVSLAVTAVNLLWLLPWAVAAKFHPALAAWFTLSALAPLVLLAVSLGAGRSETA